LAVGVEEGLDVVAKGLADVEDGSEVPLTGPGWEALVGGAGDLVEVATDGVELGDATLESSEFSLRQGSEISQVGTDEERNVGSGGHRSGSGALTDEEPILSS